MIRWLFLVCVQAVTQASGPRSVNLALETTFEFNEERDMALLKNVRHVIDKIESNVERKLIARERTGDYKFTDFLQELISVINTYEDDDFSGVFRALYHVVYNHRGTESSGLFNGVIRSSILDALKKTSETPVQQQKERLRKISLLLRKTEKSHATFINFLNLLYKGKSPFALKRVLRGFRVYRQRPSSESSLRELVRDAAEYLVYAHYAGLDASVRRDVDTWLRAMLKGSGLRTWKRKIARTTTRHQRKHTGRQTFVTLYPEGIVINKVQRNVTWRKVTIADRNGFYLVKGKRRVFKDNDTSYEDADSNGSSLEKETTTRKLLTKSMKELRRRTKPISDSGYLNPRKALITKQNPTDKVYWRNSNESRHTTTSNNSVSNQYLERIKQLELQIIEMKKELEERKTTKANTHLSFSDQYDYFNIDREANATETKNTSKSNIDTETKNETDSESIEKINPIFRSKDNESLSLGDGPLSTEIKNFLMNQSILVDREAANSTNVTENSETVAIKTRPDNATTLEPKATTVASTYADKITNLVSELISYANDTSLSNITVRTNGTAVDNLTTDTTPFDDPVINQVQ